MARFFLDTNSDEFLTRMGMARIPNSRQTNSRAGDGVVFSWRLAVLAVAITLMR